MPLIWVLTGSKAGDNAQVLRAAEAMELGFDTKTIVVKPEFETAKPRVTASLHHIDPVHSDELAAPWPDLVITIGRRLSLVALWIKQQSGGRTRIALFNAPKGHETAFDLVVLPAFYTFKDSTRVLKIGLPLIAIDPVRLEAGRIEFKSQFGSMDKPLHVLLLGGDMGRRTLEPAFAVDVLERMRRSHAAAGSIFVSTSRRTPPAVAEAISRHLRPCDRMFRWTKDGAGNPYMGLLAFGESFTVTGDSLSMMTEVARLGRPLYIAEPPAQWAVLDSLLKGLGVARPRDLGQAVDYLVAGRHAARLGEPWRRSTLPLPDDTSRVAERLKMLAMTGN